MQYYKDCESYRDDLIHLCDRIVKHISDDLDVYIRSDDGSKLTEDLSQKIRDRNSIISLFEGFRVELRNISLDNLADMQFYLSSDFPTDKGQYPTNMEPLRLHGLVYETRDGLDRYEVEPTDFSKLTTKLLSNTVHFSESSPISFKISNHRALNAGNNLAVRWRITNDPVKAAHDIRGQLLPRGGKNEFIHSNETARYDGIHRAEVFVTNREENRVVGVGRYKVKKVDEL